MIGSVTTIFNSEALLPPAWKTIAAAGPVRVFNPAILAARGEYLFAYRIVLHDGLRRLAACRLTRQLQLIPGSLVPISDHIQFVSTRVYPTQAVQWFADPRFLAWHGRIMLYWNSGCHEPSNYQFIQELDPETLQPIGVPRELVLTGLRAKFEKNWLGFCQGHDLYFIYTITPFRVLKLVEMTEAECVCEDFSLTAWDVSPYMARHGEMRGGTPPVLADGRYYMFPHSSPCRVRRRQYYVGFLGFSAHTPFAPDVYTPVPINLFNPFKDTFLYKPLNSAVSEVVYPCGAVFDDSGWLISYGINDEHCAVAWLDHEELLQQTCPVRRTERGAATMHAGKARRRSPWKRGIMRLLGRDAAPGVDI